MLKSICLDGECMDISLDSVYPVGSIYMSTADVDPSALFGGTWAKIEGQFLLSSGGGYTLGSVGGAATCLLHDDECALPLHSHAIGGAADYFYIGEGAITRTSAGGSGKNGVLVSADSAVTRAGQTNNAGGYYAASAHNNMPPYIVVNVWQRTA